MEVPALENLHENLEIVLLTGVAREHARGSLTMQKISDAQVKTFEAAEMSVVSAVAKHVRDCVREAGKNLEDSLWEPEPANAEAQSQLIIESLVSLEEWQEDLNESVLPTLAAVFASGAASELQMIEGLKSRQVKTTAQELAAELDLSLEGFSLGEFPEWLLAAAREAAMEVFSQDYWTKIPETTLEDIRAKIEHSLIEGLSIREVAQSIIGMVDDTGATYDRIRALRVARTETGHMLNAGHLAAIENVEEETGLAIGKTWISVLGSTTRETHAALSSTTVGREEEFSLGGVQVPHPSHWKLPAGERINCQCTIISSLLTEGLME